MNRKQLMPGTFLTVMEADKFNRCRIAVHFQFPADREDATAAAVLPLVLERGYAQCPDMTALSKKLAKLYGADLGVDQTVNGGNRILTVDITGIKDEFALYGENLSREYAEIVLGVAFDPYFVDGTFDAGAVSIEKKTLAQRLEAEVNDKRLYCVRQARRRFFNGSPAGIERDGYLEELPMVNENSLKAVYEKILATATIDVIVQGADAEAVEQMLCQKLALVQRAPAALIPALVMPVQPVLHETEKFKELVQAKLCLLFTADKVSNPRDLSAARLAMSLFGGSVTSRLFLNVREKQSICYYCGSSCNTISGCMMVDSGVEPKQAARAEQAILQELAQLVDGPITDEELEDCRRGLVSGLDSVEDNLSSIENWYYMEICRGEELYSPQKARDDLFAVTRDDVKQILKSYHLSVSYLVTKEGESA